MCHTDPEIEPQTRNNSAFTVSKVVWQYEPSRLTNSRNTVPTKIDAMEVACNGCGHKWTARRYGAGSFESSMTHKFLACPKCGEDGEIANSDLSQK